MHDYAVTEIIIHILTACMQSFCLGFCKNPKHAVVCARSARAIYTDEYSIWVTKVTKCI